MKESPIAFPFDMENKCCKKSKHGIYLKVKVIPRASKNEVIGIVGDRLKIMVKAPPQNGEANDVLEDIIATFFRVKKSSCTVTAGHKTSRKIVFISTGSEGSE